MVGTTVVTLPGNYNQDLNKMQTFSFSTQKKIAIIVENESNFLSILPFARENLAGRTSLCTESSPSLVPLNGK